MESKLMLVMMGVLIFAVIFMTHLFKLILEVEKFPENTINLKNKKLKNRSVIIEMGIKQLMQLIQEKAPRSVKQIQLDLLTGKVVACDASMAIY